MARLTTNESFDFPVTRQELYDMFANATLSGLTINDFEAGFIPIITGSTFSDAPSSPTPGQLFWHRAENVMYCYHDEVSDTGVSLWLAVGPDKFECAMLTVEPVASAWPLDLTGTDRMVQVANAEVTYPVGFNQSGINDPLEVNGLELGGETAASGSWIRAGVDGIIYGKIEDSADSWTTAKYVGLDTSSTGSLISTGQLTPTQNIVGVSTEWAVTPTGGNPPSEAPHTLKFQFQPRILRGFDN